MSFPSLHRSVAPLAAILCGLLITSLVSLVLPSSTQAQSRSGMPSQLSEASEIALVTGLPGNRLHTEFGHSAIRVYDPVAGFDVLYNYGTFSFSDPAFVPKFIYGQLDYFLSVSTFGGMVGVYDRQGRPVVVQTLNLTLAQKNALYRYLQINRLPENRYYRYDFLYDNCSTRVRDVFLDALGGAVAFSDRPDPDRTFRQMLDLYVHDRPALDLGFDLGLGMPADKDVSPHDAMFLPEFLMEAFDHATIRIDDQARPLVASTDTLRWRDGYDGRKTVFPWTLPLTWGLALLVLGATAVQWRRGSGPGRALDVTLLTVTGLAGLVILFLWFVSLHEVTARNWNLAWALPTHLFAAVALLRGTGASWLRRYWIGTAGLAGLLLLAWPFLPQNMHPALWPVVLLLAVRLGFRAYVQTWTPAMEAA